MKVVWVFDDVTRDTSSSLSSLSSASSSSIAVFIYSIIVRVGLDLPLIYAKGREYYTSYLLRALILLKTLALYKPFTYLFTYLLTYLPPKGKIELRQLTCVFRRTSAAPLANFLHLFGPSSRILVASYRSVIFWTTHSACEMTNTWRRVSSRVSQRHAESTTRHCSNSVVSHFIGTSRPDHEYNALRRLRSTLTIANQEPVVR